MLLKDKVALVTGVANELSIAYHTAKQFAENGAKVILSYQGERLKERVEELGKQINAVGYYDCDATNEEEVKKLFDDIDKEYDGLDIFVHSIAYADKSELTGGITNSTAGGFKLAQEVSAYTLIGMSKYAIPLMEKKGGGSIMTMTYIGSVRALPSYNTMGVAKASLEASMRYLAYECGPKGIRVNAISPGPIRTIAARSIPGFTDLCKNFASTSFMKRNLESEDVAGTAVYLASDLSKLVTGMVIYVDGGFHCSGFFA